MVLDRKTKDFQELKVILKEDGGEQLTITGRYFCFGSWSTSEQTQSNWVTQHVVWLFPLKSLTKGFSVQDRLTLDPAGVLHQDVMLQRWAALCKLMTEAKCNDPFYLWSMSLLQNQAQLPRGHSAFQAGEQGSKFNKAFTVKGMNLHRPTELLADSQAIRYIHGTTAINKNH